MFVEGNLVLVTLDGDIQLIWRIFLLHCRRHLHWSEITACALDGLIPIFCSCISQFWQGSYLNFNCLSRDEEELFVFFLVWQVTSSQTGQADKSLKRFIPMMKSGGHACISKIMKVSSTVPCSLELHHKQQRQKKTNCQDLNCELRAKQSTPWLVGYMAYGVCTLPRYIYHSLHRAAR